MFEILTIIFYQLIIQQKIFNYINEAIFSQYMLFRCFACIFLKQFFQKNQSEPHEKLFYDNFFTTSRRKAEVFAFKCKFFVSNLLAIEIVKIQMKATEDHQSLFRQVKNGLKKNWPPYRKVELKKNEYWNEVDISFEEAEFHQGYKLSVVKLILEYNKIISKALKSQQEIPINDIDDLRRDFKFIHVNKDHIMNELKKCPYMSPEQAKEMFEFMISGPNFHGPMLKFCVDCVTQKYKGEMAFLFCVFCQIQKTLLENTESQKEMADHALQRNRGKRVAEELGPHLRGKLKSFLVPQKVANLQIENATKEFFKEFCSVVMKMIEGLSMKN